MGEGGAWKISPNEFDILKFILFMGVLYSDDFEPELESCRVGATGKEGTCTENSQAETRPVRMKKNG